MRTQNLLEIILSTSGENWTSILGHENDSKKWTLFVIFWGLARVRVCAFFGFFCQSVGPAEKKACSGLAGFVSRKRYGASCCLNLTVLNAVSSKREHARTASRHRLRSSLPPFCCPVLCQPPCKLSFFLALYRRLTLTLTLPPGSRKAARDFRQLHAVLDSFAEAEVCREHDLAGDGGTAL